MEQRAESVMQSIDRTDRLIAMGQMAATLAHEIRNPLGIMELNCTLLKRELENNSEGGRLAEQIHQAIRRLEQVIASCLRFANGAPPKRKSIGSLDAVLGEIQEDVRSTCEEKGVSLEIESSSKGEAYIDAFQLQQVLLNLALNAIDAVVQAKEIVGEGFVPVVSLASNIDGNGKLEVSVKDNGIGISQREVEQVFDPFFSTKQGGTGLGLAIVHSIIAAHGGGISVDSKSIDESSAHGTEFLVSIPGNQKRGS